MGETFWKLNKSNGAYRKFKLIFHSIILIFALCLLGASILGFNEMERAPFYITLSILFIIQSVVVLYKSRN